jgi:hypothetical protein
MTELVKGIPEIVNKQADLKTTYAGVRQNDVWALVTTQQGMYEYRGTTQPLTRTPLDRSTDVNALVLQRSLEGFEDLSATAPTARFEGEYRGAKRSKRKSKRSRRRRIRRPSI